MRISVIIPVFNGERYLQQALDSVFGQSRVPDEVIGIDDGGTDSSSQILSLYGEKIRFISQENAGVASARNTGITMANGELITFIDQDDLWPAHRMQALEQALIQYPEAEVAVGRVELLDQRSELSPSPFEQIKHREILMGSLCVRASLFKKLGPLSTNLGYADDTDFYIRRKEAETKTVYINDTTLIYRQHDRNTSTAEKSRDLLLDVLRSSLIRRRSK